MIKKIMLNIAALCSINCGMDNIYELDKNQNHKNNNKNKNNFISRSLEDISGSFKNFFSKKTYEILGENESENDVNEYQFIGIYHNKTDRYYEKEVNFKYLDELLFNDTGFNSYLTTIRDVTFLVRDILFKYEEQEKDLENYQKAILNLDDTKFKLDKSILKIIESFLFENNYSIDYLIFGLNAKKMLYSKIFYNWFELGLIKNSRTREICYKNIIKIEILRYKKTNIVSKILANHIRFGMSGDKCNFCLGIITPASLCMISFCFQNCLIASIPFCCGTSLCISQVFGLDLIECNCNRNRYTPDINERNCIKCAYCLCCFNDLSRKITKGDII